MESLALFAISALTLLSLDSSKEFMDTYAIAHTRYHA